MLIVRRMTDRSPIGTPFAATVMLALNSLVLSSGMVASIVGLWHLRVTVLSVST